MIVNINFACNKPQNMLANDDGFPEILHTKLMIY